jgi:hypothetical protein
MARGFEYTEIGTWLSDLPDGLVASVGQASEPDAAFAFVVRADPVDVTVAAPDAEGPLVIRSTLTFSAEVRAAIQRDPDRFLTEARPVLASTPGIHRLTDGEGSDVDAESLSAVRLRHYVYPDAASKHEVLTGVLDLMSATRHLQRTGKRMARVAGDP